MNQSPPKRTARPHKFASTFDRMVSPILKKRGFAAVRLVADWPAIVGEEYARFSIPKKIQFQKDKQHQGVLHIEVINSVIAMQLAAIEGMILQRIATYFGYQPVQRIKLTHNPQLTIEQNQPPSELPLAKEQQQQIAKQVQSIEEETLSTALQSLGEAICRSQSRQEEQG